MDASTSLAPWRPAFVIAAILCIASAAHAQTLRVNPAGLQAGAQNDRFIVQYRADADVPHLAGARERVRRNVALAPAAAWSVAPTVSHAIAPGTYVVRSSQPMNAAAAEAWMRRLADDSAIEFVEVDTTLRTHAQPNDKWYTSQLHLFGGYGVQADLAWSMNRGRGVNVGVIDTGLSPHPDVDPALLPGYDFVDNDAQPAVAACAGMVSTHGTMVAGTIAAITDNSRGVASVAPEAKIVPARVTTGCGSDSDVTHASNLIRALEWLSGGAVEGVPVNGNPVEVINISLGGATPCSAGMQSAITRAVGRGATVVVAAGNNDIDAIYSQPANCNYVVAVGGTDYQGRRIHISNWGPGVDIAAPAQIYWPRVDDSEIVYDQGTSFSAPMVASIAALMHAASRVTLTPARIERLLRASAKPFSAPQYKPLGAGIANAPAALSMAQSVDSLDLDGAYVMVVRGLLPGQENRNGCLIVGNNGNATRPEFFRWSGGGAPETCGLGNDDVLLANAQAVWDITPVTNRNDVTAHIIRSRVNGQCLIRGNNGTDAAASLYLWGDTTDMRWCGLPSADALIDNGQAAWYLDAPFETTENGKTVTTVGLKQVRPHFAHLGFDPTGVPGETRFRNEPEWQFRMHPVTALPSGILVGVPFRIVSRDSGECLDIRGGVSRGAELITWPCHSGNNQKWVYQGGQLRVDGMCLDVSGGRKENGVTVHAWPCHAYDNQRWTMQSDGRIRSLMTGDALCLNVHPHHDNHVRTYECGTNENNQRFTFRAF